jgi:hypothetical protein
MERARRAAELPDDPEEAKRKNQFFLFGFGIVAYLDLIYTFFWLFILLSFVTAPAVNFYSQYKGYKNYVGYEGSTLGNMGASSAQCVNVPLNVDSTPMHCPFGHIGHIKDFGVTPSGADQMDNCLNNNYTATCHKNLNPAAKKGLDVCIGQSSCTMNATLDIVYGDF